MAGFAYRKNIDGSAYAPSVITYLIGKNSVEFSVGDAVRVNTSGFVDVSDATEGIAGICVGVTDANGKAITPDSGTTDTWTMNSANQTSSSYQYRVHFIPALPNYLFYNNGTNDTAAGDVGAYCDLTSAAIASNTFGDTTAQLKLWERDPDGDSDDSKGLYQIVESQFATTDAVPAS